jgi:hypothetical protein
MDWLRKAAAVPVSPVTARGVPLVNEPTDPIGPPDAGGAPQRHDDITAESAERAADEESCRSFSHRGRRAVLISLACVAALLVGFESVTVLLKLGDRPAQSDTEPAPTTVPPVAPPPSAAAPAVTTPSTSAASSQAVQNESPPPAPESAPPASASAPPASASAPTETTSPANLKPVGNTPPGLNR